ncbi:hypothetical protein JXI42_06445 [bacterium]|nr:hypothetical protein [bacterium]
MSYWVFINHDTTIQMDYEPIKKYVIPIENEVNWHMVGSIHSSHVWDSSTYCFNPDPEGYFD